MKKKYIQTRGVLNAYNEAIIANLNAVAFINKAKNARAKMLKHVVSLDSVEYVNNDKCKLELYIKHYASTVWYKNASQKITNKQYAKFRKARDLRAKAEKLEYDLRSSI